MNAPTPSQSPATDRKEIALALGALFVGTGLLALVQLAVPSISGWLQALLAVLLLTIPGWVLRRSDRRIDDLGVEMGPWARTLPPFALAAVVVFPLFAGGFHLVQTRWLDRQSQWDLTHVSRWDRALLDYPGRVCEPGREDVRTWIDSSGLWLVGPEAQGLSIAGTSGRLRRVHCDAERGPLATSAVRPGPDGRVRVAPGEGLWMDLKDQEEIGLRVSSSEGEPIPSARLLRGAHGEEADTDGELEGHRGLGWLLPYIIIQLGLVALPEEWFFRGYLQARLDEQMGTPWRFLGTSVGPGLVLAALAFALLHPILLPGLHRLLVFFPALLFGWLRARTGNIGAAVLMHATCNLLLEVLTGMYA